MTEIMDKKQFEKNARMFLKYGIGHNIEEAREHLRKLIKAGKAKQVRSWVEG